MHPVPPLLVVDKLRLQSALALGCGLRKFGLATYTIYSREADEANQAGFAIMAGIANGDLKAQDYTYEDACPHFERATQISNTCHVAFLNLGICYASVKNGCLPWHICF